MAGTQAVSRQRTWTEDMVDTRCSRNPELWFSEERAVQLRAARLCGGCPLLEACRRLGAGERFGVWGGTTPAERGALRSRPAA